MDQSIPNTMRAIFQEKAGGPLTIKEIAVPDPKSGEVLIKMFASPVNPSDLSFLQGTYAIQRPYPVVPGIEGSGIVVAHGKGIFPKLRQGKRVMCSSSPDNHGTWAEYMVTSAMKCVPVQDNITDEEAATLIVNPMTALALIDIAKKGKYKAIVNNAAAGALGQMMINLAQKENIKLINIVRRKEQVDFLKKMGCKYTLDSSDTDFDQQFKELALKLNATLVLDAVGGKHAEILIKNAPHASKLITYAKLSEETMCFDTRILVQQEKEIHGFYLANWNKNQSILKVLGNTKKVQKLVKNELKTNIQATFPFEQANEALDLYKNNMSAGKVLFKM